MSKLEKGTIFSSYEEVKKEIAAENAKWVPTFLKIFRTKRRRSGLKKLLCSMC